MFKLKATELIKIINYLSKAETVFSTTKVEKIDPEIKSSIISWLDGARDICQELGLQMSIIQIDRVKKSIHLEGCKPKDLREVFGELNSRVADEVGIPVFFVMKQDKVNYYEKANLFGDSVFNKFPSANFDIEEAGKCFATTRYTACVMHLQRVLEVGLKSYGNYLGVACLANSTQPSWNKVLDQTRKEMKERDDKLLTAKNWTSTEEKEFCEGVQPFLEAIKVAWRNPSMHADKIYSEEIAEDIFSAVKRFMRHLAEHLDESGVYTP